MVGSFFERNGLVGIPMRRGGHLVILRRVTGIFSFNGSCARGRIDRGLGRFGRSCYCLHESVVRFNVVAHRGNVCELGSGL